MRLLAITCAAGAAALAISPAPSAVRVRLTAATLHAAALTTARNAGDSSDAPYLLVSMLDARGRATAMELPEAGHLAIHLDEALAARPLADVAVERGDSVRVVVSLLEDPVVRRREEVRAAGDAAAALRRPPAERAAAAAAALAPLVRHGAHWLGTATFVVTNDDGAAHWRALECLTTCTVSRAPATAPLGAAGGASASVVIQFNGSGATYHLQVNGALAP